MNTDPIEEMIGSVLQMTVDDQMVYDTLTDKQKDCLHANIRKAVTAACTTSYEKGKEEGAREERRSWLEHERCEVCGGEKEKDYMTVTCDKCLEEE